MDVNAIFGVGVMWGMGDVNQELKFLRKLKKNGGRVGWG